MVRYARVRAFAKLNLSLKVLHRREDGFHELRTVFQTIGLHDVLEVEYERSRRSEVSVASTIEIENNLILKASRRFLEATRGVARIRVRLTKRIPMGGGLGGGSSDAAAMLLTLPVLAGKHLTSEALLECARELGSDVPYFLHGGTTLGLGRGEELYPLPEMKALPALVVTPGVHVSTAEAYQSLGRGLTSAVESPKLNVFQSFVWRESSVSAAENDFESAVIGQHPELRRWLRKLESSGARPARMSGSGSSLFGIYPDAAGLRAALPLFSGKGVGVYPTRLLSRRRYRAAWWMGLQDHIDGLTWPPQSRYLR